MTGITEIRAGRLELRSHRQEPLLSGGRNVRFHYTFGAEFLLLLKFSLVLLKDLSIPIWFCFRIPPDNGNDKASRPVSKMKTITGFVLFPKGRESKQADHQLNWFGLI